MTTAVCLFALFVFAVDAQVFPSLLARIPGTPAHHGLLLSALFLMFPVTSAVAGYAADRLGKRTVLAAGAALMAVPFAVAATVDALWAWGVTALLFGMGSGIVEGQSSALLSDSHPGKERWAMSLSQAVYCVGAVAGPLAIALAHRMSRELRIEHTFAAAGALSFLLLAAFVALRGTRAHSPASRPAAVRALLSDRQWRLLCLALFLYVGVESCTVTWLAKYGATVLRMPDALAPVCIAVFWAGIGVSRGITAGLPAGIDSGKLLTGALVVSLVTHIATFAVSSAAAALGMFGILGLSMGSIWPTIVARAGQRYRESSGAAIGILVAAGGLAIPLIEPLIGWLSETPRVGLRGALLSLSLLTLANIFVALRLAAITRSPLRHPS